MKQVMQYVAGDSFFHRLHPLTKLMWAVLTCVACFMCENLYFLTAIVLFNVAIAIGSGIYREAKSVFKMFFILGFFLMLFQMLFMNEGNRLFGLSGVIVITDKGLSSGLLLALRMSGALLPLSVMIMITPINDLSAEMVDKLHIPDKYAFVLTTALRFIPTFSNEMNQIIQAQVARGCDLDTKNIFKKIKVIIPMSMPLLISSIRKIEKQAITLEIRGFNSPQRSRYKQIKASSGDGVVSIYLIVLLVVGFIL